MLVLSRKPGEAIRIGAKLCVRVVSVTGGRVRLAIDAPPDVAVHREEIVLRIAQANQAAANAELPELCALPAPASPSAAAATSNAPSKPNPSPKGERPWTA
jgi:carbon storage regulator